MFLDYNLTVSGEEGYSWGVDGPEGLKTKLVFGDYRFGLTTGSRKRNELVIDFPDGRSLKASKPIVAIGSGEENEIVLDESMSTRHAVILNFPDDVWVQDLWTGDGTYVDGQKVVWRTFLDGVHEVRLGRLTLRVTRKAGLAAKPCPLFSPAL